MSAAALIEFMSTSANGSRAGARGGDDCIGQEECCQRPPW